MSRMLVLVGLLLASLSAGAVMLLVLGFAAFIERRWKEAGVKLAAGAASSLIGALILVRISRSLLQGHLWMEGVDPALKARALAENISGLMNVTVLGLPFGLVAGIILLWRRRMRRAA